MGSGASAQASEGVTGASAADLQAALDQLPEGDRAKLQEALKQAQAPAAAAAPEGATAEADAAPAEVKVEAEAPAAPAEVKAEAAAPADEAIPADGAADPTPSPAAAAGANPSPFLSEYFDKAKARTAALIGDEEKLLALALDPEAQKKLKEESKAWFESDARPLLEKSFKHHDTKKTDVLDKEEAALFFAHMVHEETDLAKAMSALSIEAGVKMSLRMLEGMSQEDREAIKPQIELQMKQAILAAQTEVQKKEDQYKGSKSEHDAAAMKVLDTNGDGTIQLAEFMAAFEPETEKNVELHIALGYLTKEEVEAQKKAEEEAKNDAKALQECNQQ